MSYRAAAYLPVSVSIALVVTSERSALADGRDPPSAETLFRDGRASARASDYRRACLSFAESFALDAAPGTLLNLADCEEHVGLLANAWEHYNRLEGELPQSDGRSALAQERARALAPRVPYLTIDLAANTPAAARVFRDDVELGRASLALPLPVNPGTHVVLVTAPGRLPERTTVYAAEGERLSLSVRIGPAEALSIRRTVGWSAGAAGLASMGMAAYFGAHALSERNSSDAHCTSGLCADSVSLGTYESARSDALAADVSLGIGLVALAIGSYLLLTSFPDEASHPSAVRMSAAGLGGVW
jgi:hypothetical protein